MTPRGTTRLKIWLVIIGVFILGGATGVLLDGVYRLRASGNARPEMHNGNGHHAEEVIEHMKSDLNLSDDQVTQIRAILDQTRNDYRALRTEVRPRYDAVRQNARSKIRALLNAEQQRKFDAKVAEIDARRERDDK